MAIVHIATKAISRKAGQSAVASAAYRAGDILKDDRYDKTHDYSKKSGMMSTDIILPSALKAQGFSISREEIWNKAEKVESRKDSRVAREWLINLPYELNEEKRKALAHEFAQTLANRYNIIADCAVHAPSKREIARGADPRNYHAHILVTTREAQLDADGKLFFDRKFKIPFEWSNKKREDNGLISSVKEIKNIRQVWVDMANKALAEHDLTPLDARSFKDQGLDRLPTIKMGVDATNMERKGINTDKGNENRAVSVINERKEMTKQRKQRKADERHTIEYTEWSTDRIEWADYRNQQIVQCLDDSQQRVDRRQQDIRWALGEYKETRKVTEGSSKRAGKNSKNAEWAIGRNDDILRIPGTREPEVKTREDRLKEFEQQAEGFDRLIADRTNAIATTPSPFDDNSRRARATRLAEQEERFDRKSAEYDRGVESARERARLVRLSYAQKFLERHKEHNRLRPGHRESSDDYPNKFDYRQNDLLDDFAENLNLNKVNGEDHRDYLRRISDTFSSAFIKENRAVIGILRDPKVEREQYDTIKIDFDNFINSLDEQRQAIDSKTRKDLGNTGEISRMTAESLSAPSYIKLLEDYINHEATVNQNKDLAIKHRSDTINRTFQQFKHGMIGLRDIQHPDTRKTHSEALQGSLDNFMSSYGKELSNEQERAIESSMSATKQQVQSNNIRLRR